MATFIITGYITTHCWRMRVACDRTDDAVAALAMAAGTGLAPKACSRMSVQRGPQVTPV